MERKSPARRCCRQAAIAAHDDALAARLAAGYAKQAVRKLAKAARAVARVLKNAAKMAGRAAVTVAKAAYKYSGAQDVVSCVTHPQLSSCVKAALTVALVVATAGEGEAEVAAIDAAEQAGTDVLLDTGSVIKYNSAKDLLGAGEQPVVNETVERELGDVAARKGFLGGSARWRFGDR